MPTSTISAAGTGSSPFAVLARESADWSVSSAAFNGRAFLQQRVNTGDWRNLEPARPGARGTVNGPGEFRVFVEAMGLGESISVTFTANDDVLWSVTRADGTPLAQARAQTGLAIGDNFALTPTGAQVARPVKDKLGDVLSVKDFGAKGDNTTDDTAAIQACIDAVFLTGGVVYFPAGKYRITSKLYLDVRGVTGTPGTNIRRVNFRGDGKGNTVLKPNVDGLTCLHIQGDNPLTTASHAYITLSDFAIQGNSPTARTCTGLWLQDLAYLTVRDVSFHNLSTDLRLTGCLASSFEHLIFNESTYGVVAESGASGPHSNLWLGCEFRQITGRGYDGFTTLSGATFVNCRWEGCGTMGDATTGALRQSTTGSAGEHGITLIGCYIEDNRGGFDIQLNETGSQRVTLNVTGSCFNRISGTAYVTNNIVTTGDVDVNLQGCTFTSYNDYTADAARPYLNLSSTTRFRDLGNRYEDAVEAPTLSQSLPFAGFVRGSLGASVTGTLPNGWTVSQAATGVFVVVHNLGHTNYVVTGSANSSNVRSVQRFVPAANSFQAVVVNGSGVAADDDFAFALQILKPAR